MVDISICCGSLVWSFVALKWDIFWEVLSRNIRALRLLRRETSWASLGDSHLGKTSAKGAESAEITLLIFGKMVDSTFL
jgi:hypothetical protein